MTIEEGGMAITNGERSAILRAIDDLRADTMTEFGRQSGKLDALEVSVKRVSDEQFRRGHEEDRRGRRLKAVEGEVERMSKQAEGPDWQRDPRDITGVHNLRELSDWKKKQEESALWWQRQRWVWAMGIVAALLIAGVGGCVSYAISHVEVRK